MTVWPRPSILPCQDTCGVSSRCVAVSLQSLGIVVAAAGSSEFGLTKLASQQVSVSLITDLSSVVKIQNRIPLYNICISIQFQILVEDKITVLIQEFSVIVSPMCTAHTKQK